MLICLTLWILDVRYVLGNVKQKEKIVQGSLFLVSKILFNNHPNRGTIHFTSLQENVNIVILCDHVLVIRFIMSIILS